MNMQKCYLSMHRYKAFLKVAEVGSFIKAAELLGYTQPALSQMMTSLERELSMKLLYRSRYGIRLTPEGERLYPSVESAVRQYDAMRRSADEISGLATGVVRIGTVSSVSAHWLPQVIRTFWEKHPNVQIVLHQGDYSLLSMVEQGMGVSILVELVLHKTAYDVAALPIEPPIIRTLAVVTKDRRTLPLAAKVFIDELVASRGQLL